jgi:hypothetical protein
MISLATLSFLGLGVQPPTPEWGNMVVEARPYLQADPWLFLLPAAAITLVVAALNLVAEHTEQRGPTLPRPRSFRSRPAIEPHAGPLLTVSDLVVELDTLERTTPCRQRCVVHRRAWRDPGTGG